ncbi:glycoside hydrolase family 9 protein [Gaoshiqia sediminis]|uniref:Glycoside hydrolase family 9 protein n=1 Tax=Gaoshiqia sediminis TaxID=2986998 RepID=A0AA41Y972_9BACT|nr:glycoside hydrolase family 9 protein [Gaoshiqia sediminis]MCW0483268.1 glycoside hydrolase family 9 protein [Gaoshiqia sediminis]
MNKVIKRINFRLVGQKIYSGRTSKTLNKLVFVVLLLFVSAVGPMSSFGQKMQVNDLEYFETRGVNVLVFSSEYNGMFFDEKTAGIEIIQHGVRTSTGGAIRLQNTPEQWDLVPKVVDRKVNRENNSIEVTLTYEDLDFNSRLLVSSKGKGLEISVFLDEPLPEKLEGQAGFNLEFLPSAYFERSYLMDGQPGVFPKYPSSNTRIEPGSKKIKQFAGHNTFEDRGRDEFIVPYQLATGKIMVLAPEDPERFVTIKSMDADLMFFDGRNVAQNGWFIVRSLLPAGKTGKVLTWYLEPNAMPDWIRTPVVGFSQVGYVPQQEKVAIIELDKNDNPLKTASVFKVNEDGKFVEAFKGDVVEWGDYLRYNYAKFDFSAVKEPGVYCIQYGDQRTNIFPIGPDVYAGTWHPTLDVWFPVQMDHMQVNEAYRVWHGEPYKDDCLQAPLNHQHFDGYSQGPTTDTKYKPLERIPGMAVGGWFDAGDFDIQTGSHNSVISSFVELWEEFNVQRDQTYIDQKTRYVDIHRPDGKPDILQQIEHGVLNLVAQVENIGHPVRGIIVPNLHQYHHLGDASTETDNLPYNPDLKPYETDGVSSGTPDDRWAFTNRSSYLDYQTAATLAAASRALKGYNDELANKCLAYAKKLLEEADEAVKNSGNESDESWMRLMARGADLNTVLQLYITTKETKYLDRFEERIWTILDQSGQGRDFGQMFFASRSLNPALKAIPYMNDDYKAKLESYILKYKASVDEMEKNNPYGLPISRSGWGGSGMVVNAAITNYYAHKAFPAIIDREHVFRGLNFIFGCHPYSNISFVNAVGTRSKKVAYGINRADFTTIAGGIVPGLLLLKPDFLENKDDWPFLWGENEVTIGGSAEYIVLANAVLDMIKE